MDDELKFNPKAYYYEKKVDKYSDTNAYYDLISLLNDKIEIVSSTVIGNDESLKIGVTSYSSSIKHNGKPNYANNSSQKKDVKTLYYKQFIGEHKTKLELHFYKNNLFFYCYTFSHLKENDKEEIIKILEQKYFNSGSLDVQNNYLKDLNNIHISFIDNIDFTINYFDPKSEIFEMISKDLQKGKGKIFQKEKNNSKMLYKRL